MRIFIGLLTLSVFTVCSTQSCIGNGVYNEQFTGCYHFLSSPQDAVEAALVCDGIGGHLVIIHNAFEQTFVFGSARDHFAGDDYWIGLSYHEAVSQWRWSDGSLLDYAFWTSGYPTDPVVMSCAAMNIKTGHWYNLKCDDSSKHYICEVTVRPDFPQGKCEGDGVYHEGRCLYFIKSQQSSSAALLTCGDLSATLVSLNTADMQNFVFEAVKERNFNADYWIGLHEQPDSGNWQWSDNSSLSFTNWENAFPMYGDGFECVAVLADNGKWYNTLCDDILNTFVCELDLQEDWHFYNVTNAVYKVIENVTVDEGEAICVEQRGHLVSIHSADENHFVSELVRQIIGNQTCPGDMYRYQTWLGLRFVEPAKTLYWTDGSDVDYVQWQPGDPDHLCSYGGSPPSSCVQMMTDWECALPYPEQWSDNCCHYILRSAVCKKLR